MQQRAKIVASSAEEEEDARAVGTEEIKTPVPFHPLRSTAGIFHSAAVICLVQVVSGVEAIARNKAHCVRLIGNEGINTPIPTLNMAPTGIPV